MPRAGGGIGDATSIRVFELCRRGDVEGLLDALGDPEVAGHQRLRFAIVEKLGDLGDARAEPHVLAMLDDSDAAVRTAAIQSLGKLRARSALPHLHPLLNASAGSRAQVDVIEALGAIGDPRSVAPLTRALSNEKRSVRTAAAEALVAIGDPESVDPILGAAERAGIFERRVLTRLATRLQANA